MLFTFGRHLIFYGLLAGAAAIGATILWVNAAWSKGPLGMPIGYLIMFVALSLIFVGVKQHRDSDLGGVIKFGRASLVGLSIAIIAALVYVLVWEGYLFATDYSFISDYVSAAVQDIESGNLTETEAAAKRAEIEQFQAFYGTPLLRGVVSFTEIFPVGIVVSLISAILLRNPDFMPARQ